MDAARRLLCVGACALSALLLSRVLGRWMFPASAPKEAKVVDCARMHCAPV